MAMTAIPKGILLDIEGTTSSISFVHEIMFPFVLGRLDQFLIESFGRPEVQTACEQIAKDAGFASLAAWNQASPDSSPTALVQHEVRRLMASDVKATGLKALQGLIWDGGFRSGQLKAHVYPEVIPAIRAWRTTGIDVRIYSSGSIAAQKLFFGHLDGFGDCLDLFSGHYDTTIGGKKDAESYRKIVADWGLAASDVIFISDIADELVAASQAGLQVRASLRPGNTALPTDLIAQRISSFEEVLA